MSSTESSGGAAATPAAGNADATKVPRVGDKRKAEYAPQSPANNSHQSQPASDTGAAVSRGARAAGVNASATTAPSRAAARAAAAAAGSVPAFQPVMAFKASDPAAAGPNAPEALLMAADSRKPSVDWAPLAHIPAELVPESWTLHFEPSALPVASIKETNRVDAAAAKSAAAVAAKSAATSAAAVDESEQKEQSTQAALLVEHKAHASATAAATAAADAPPLPALPAYPTDFIVSRVSTTPLMLRVPSFLSPEECAEILRLAYAPGAPAWKPYRNVTYKPVHDSSGAVVSQQFAVGYTESATLFQLDYGHYSAIHPLIDRLAERVARIVNSNKLYSANMRRLLRYKPGQKFDLHADDHDRIQPMLRGRRMLTCLIYVHTEEDETGGGTVFPLLDDGSYRSAPTSGSLLVFRNFDPANDYKFDSRCQHYAETTTKGNKHAINLYFVEQEGRWWH